MFALLKTIHLLALVFGSAASLGGVFLILSAGPHDLAAPGYTNTLRKLMRYAGLVAVITLWITGALLMAWRYGVWVNGTLFNAKIAFAAILTAIVLYLNLMASGWARSGGPPSYVSTLQWTAAICLLLTVTCAGLVFG